jgi:hypothetical protein
MIRTRFDPLPVAPQPSQPTLQDYATAPRTPLALPLRALQHQQYHRFLQACVHPPATSSRSSASFSQPLPPQPPSSHLSPVQPLPHHQVSHHKVQFHHAWFPTDVPLHQTPPPYTRTQQFYHTRHSNHPAPYKTLDRAGRGYCASVRATSFLGYPPREGMCFRRYGSVDRVGSSSPGWYSSLGDPVCRILRV